MIVNDDKLRICTAKREIGWLLVHWNAMGKTDGGGMGWGLFNRLLIGNVSRRACTEKKRGREGEREAAGRLKRRREDDVGTMRGGWKTGHQRWYGPTDGRWSARRSAWRNSPIGKTAFRLSHTPRLATLCTPAVSADCSLNLTPV